MDEPIGIELTLNEARVLLYAILCALEGKQAALANPALAEAANSAAARLQNRIAQCAMDPANCPSPRRSK